MPVQMIVAGLAVDPSSNAPIVLLREREGTRVLPIWIGVIEASAIAFELEEVKTNRPMTHDLLCKVLEALGATLTRVAITALRDNTYYATLELAVAERTVTLDARPSDAIAIALRAQAAIVCHSEVLQQAGAPAEAWGAAEPSDASGPSVILPSAGAEDLLESLGPEAFGKYKM